MATLQEQFGAIVRRHRLAADLSQEALAEGAGVHFTYISLLERGKRSPTLVTLRKLATALKTSMTALVQELEREANPPAASTKKA